jgi:type II secretory pathway predicted ATPase ExeA
MNLELDERLLVGAEESIKETLDYFHLLEHPFLSGPDYRFLFTTDQVKDSISKTFQQIFHRTHHMVISGEYGNGKTTITLRMYALLKKDPRFQVKFVKVSPNITKNALLRAILREFNLKPARSAHEAETRLQEYVINLANPNQEPEQPPKPIIQPILLIDEAHYIEGDALSLIHSISGLESSRKKLLFMILTGQLPLAKNILERGELASRMKTVILSSMTAEEIKKMFQFRWQVAGGKEEDFPFDQSDNHSFEIIASLTRGVPRDALKIAADILNTLWLEGRKKTTPEEVEKISISNMKPLEQLEKTQQSTNS